MISCDAPGPAYDQLVRGLCQEFLVEAALVKMELQGDTIRVADPAALERSLTARWQVFKAQLLPAQMDLSQSNAKAMRQRLMRAAVKG